MGLIHFDAWASTFGETVTAIELAPEGRDIARGRAFAKFFNLPELMAMFKEVADIKTADQLHLPVPNAHYETIAVKPSVYQEEMVEALSERASKVHSGAVDPEGGQHAPDYVGWTKAGVGSAADEPAAARRTGQ